MNAHRRFAFRPTDADPSTTIYVDGTEAGYRTLSHWPGNSTPAALKRDLSTGIALAFAALSPREQLAVLGEFEVVANNHYDTDGVLSAFAVLRPELALPRAEVLLDAAATGDFCVWRGEAALATDLTVTALARAPDAPFAAALPPAPSDDERHAAAHAWLLENLPAVLDDPFAWRSLWADEFERILADVRRIEAGTGISVRQFPAEDLALVSSDRPVTSIGLNLAAGDATRVLLVLPSAEGFRYRFRDRVESWFELVSRTPPRRGSLAGAVEELEAAEAAARERRPPGSAPRRGPATPPERSAPALAGRRAPSGAGSPGLAGSSAVAGEASTASAAGPRAPGPRWWWQPPTFPLRELGYGDPAAAETVSFDAPRPERDPPSRLLPSTVIEALRRAFRG